MTGRHGLGCVIALLLLFSLPAPSQTVGEGPTGDIHAASGSGRVLVPLLEQNRSPSVAMLLDIDWIDAEWPMMENPGYGLVPAPLSVLFGLAKEKNRPAMIYVPEPEEDGEKIHADLVRLFGAEGLVVATRAFRCYRIQSSTILDAGCRAKYAGKLPAFIWLDTKGNEVAAIQGGCTTQRVLAEMTKVFDVHYKVTMKSLMTTAAKQLKEIEKAEDRAADLKRELGQLEERAEDKSTAKRQEKVAEKRKQLDRAFEAYEKAKDAFRRTTAPELAPPAPKVP